MDRQQTETLLQHVSNDESSLAVLYLMTAAEGVRLLFAGQAETAEMIFDSLRRTSGIHALGCGMTGFLRSIMTCDPKDIEAAINDLRYAEKHASQCAPLTMEMVDAMRKDITELVLTSARKVYSIYGTVSASDVTMKDDDLEPQAAPVYEDASNDGRGGPVHANYQRHHRHTSSASSVASLFRLNVSIDKNSSTTTSTTSSFFSRMFFGHRKHLSSSSSSLTLAVSDVAILERDLVIADALLMIGVLLFAQENIMSYIKGGICLRKSFKLFENAREISISHGSRFYSSNARDAYRKRWEEVKSSAHYGYGFLNVVFSALPPKLLKLIENFGIKGNRELGLKECLSTIDMGGAHTPFAELSVLAYYYILSPILGVSPAQSVGDDPAKTEARAMLDLCMTKYPNGPMFLWIYGRACKDEGALFEAIDSIDKAALLSHKENMFQMEQLCYYDLGWCCMMEFRFMEAIKAFNKAASSSSNWSPAFYSYLIGCCYLANREENFEQEALNAFEDVIKRVKKNWIGRISVVDKIALRKSKFFVQTKNASFSLGMLYLLELMYLWNCIYSCVPKLPTMLEELEKMENCKEIREPGDKRVLFCFLKGVIHRDLGHTEKAIACFELVESQKNHVHEDNYVVPHAAFDLGILYMRQKNYEKAKEVLVRARDHYSGYEFEDRLHFRLHTLLMKANSNTSA